MGHVVTDFSDPSFCVALEEIAMLVCASLSDKRELIIHTHAHNIYDLYLLLNSFEIGSVNISARERKKNTRQELKGVGGIMVH